ncbi:ATP-binding protein [Kordiimonas pumila]|uniref:histidine kinase n=1 Tax=Kordiimonas pumila TaxID=2161677 RepID=A0ABV7D2S6_9PROT|nr:ATP-binding protein [Kordiimonas pumila]
MSVDVLVCIDGHPRSYHIVEAALREVPKVGGKWRVLYLATPDDTLGVSVRREQTMRLLKRAEEMGADIVRLEHERSSREIEHYIQSCFEEGKQIGYIFIGQKAEKGFLSSFKASLAERVAKRFGKYSEIRVIPLEGHFAKPTLWDRFQGTTLSWVQLIAPLTAVTCAFLVSEALLAVLPNIMHRINTHNIALIFLLASTIVALRYGLISALIASIGSFLVINYFYVIPIGQFHMGTLTDVINVCIYLAASFIVALLGSHTRASIERTVQREQRHKALYEIHELTADAESSHQVLEILDRELHRLFKMEVAFFNPSSNVLENTRLKRKLDKANFKPYPQETELADKDWAALHKCWNEERSAGFGTMLGIGSSWRFEIICTQSGKYGVFAVKIPFKMRIDASFSQLLSALADQIATTLERIELTRDMTESRFREEREKLRSLLLSSVSHDLKTPLASIIGSMSVLRSLKASGRVTEEHVDTLTETALDEAQRLDSFITNILSMTKIESGDIEFDTAFHDPMEPLGRVLKTLKPKLKERSLNIENTVQGMEIMMDAMMTVQVLQNIIDNAIKYSPDGTDIDVLLECTDDYFHYKIRDRGPGIPEHMLERVFDKYERLNKSDSQIAGTGLGLAITKAVMSAQGGTVAVSNHAEGGAQFILSYPIVESKETGVV